MYQNDFFFLTNKETKAEREILQLLVTRSMIQQPVKGGAGCSGSGLRL